jgi:hypothetical protein
MSIREGTASMSTAPTPSWATRKFAADAIDVSATVWIASPRLCDSRLGLTVGAVLELLQSVRLAAHRIERETRVIHLNDFRIWCARCGW